MNIHKIDSHLHQSFLEEERKDAITGDLIQANDEVVFCGICKSAFLKDSWEYMNRKHCGQTKTLKSIPVSVPLLLNVLIIKPHFITLTTSSISFEECLKMLSDFSPRDKKIEVLLNPNLKKVLEKPIEKPAKKLIAKKPTKKPIKNLIAEKSINSKPKQSKFQIRQAVIRKKQQQEERELQELLKEKKNTTYLIFLCIILGTAISFFTSLVSDSFFINLLITVSTIMLCYFFISKNNLLFKKKQKDIIEQFPINNIVVLENSELEEQKEEQKDEEKIEEEKEQKIEEQQEIPKIESPVFGIFNHSLFFYFEQIQQGIFIELTRISEIEIQYQSSCGVNLILKKKDSTHEQITIPLLFSKQERITTFLLRLSKTKKDVSNYSIVKLTNFPMERIRVLKRKLMLYTDILFVEPEKIEPKNEFILNKTKSENESFSIQELIQPRDLDRLVKSQKVSRQSQNRNQHHQNRHQTQYRNYKRK